MMLLLAASSHTAGFTATVHVRQQGHCMEKPSTCPLKCGATPNHPTLALYAMRR